MQNKFTIITVCLNSERVIEKTLLSVINQNYTNYEFIIIDGLSSDETLNIVEKYKQKITKVISEEDNGIYDAMNKGIKYAKNEWLCFLNSGDYFNNNDVLNKLNQVINKHDVSVIYSDCLLIDNKEKIIGKYITDHKIKKFHHQSTFYKKALHAEYGFYINSMKSTISDYIFFCQIKEAFFKKVDFIISVYRNDGISNSISHAIQRNFFDYFMGYISLKDLFYVSFKIFKFFYKKFINYIKR